MSNWPEHMEQVKAAMRAIIASDRPDIEKVGMALKRATIDGRDGRELFASLIAKHETEPNGWFEHWEAWDLIGPTAAKIDDLLPLANAADPNWRAGIQKPTVKKGKKRIETPLDDRPVLPKYQDFIKQTAHLETAEFPPLQMTVPVYLPEGLILLFGKPKVGKSWLCLNISIGVAGLGQCLDQTCEHGDVLYLALEDSDARLKRRMVAMLGTDQWPNFDYATKWPRLDDGGLDMLNRYCDDHPRCRLIMADIFQRIRNFSKGRQSVYEADYHALEGFHTIAKERRLSFVAVHHARKAGSDDPFDNTASGSFGLTGACDAAICLHKVKGVKYLTGQGRDLQEFDIAVKQDNQHRFTVLGEGWKYRMAEESRAIVEVLSNEYMPVAEIAARIGADPKATATRLYRMLANGEIEKLEGKREFRLLSAEFTKAMQ